MKMETRQNCKIRIASPQLVAICQLFLLSGCDRKPANKLDLSESSLIDSTWSKVALAIEKEIAISPLATGLEITSIVKISNNDKGLKFRASLYPKQSKADGKRFVADFYDGGIVKIEEFIKNNPTRRISESN